MKYYYQYWTSTLNISSNNAVEYRFNYWISGTSVGQGIFDERSRADWGWIRPVYTAKTENTDNPANPGGDKTNGDDPSSDDPSSDDQKEEVKKPIRDPEVTQWVETEYGRLALDGAVDLGLSVKWGAYNFGAANPSERGKESNVFNPELYADLTEWGGTQYDKTTLELGIGWQTPSKKHWEELLSQCSFYIYTYKGAAGLLATGSNGNAIFLPGSTGSTEDFIASFLISSTKTYNSIKGYLLHLCCKSGFEKTYGWDEIEIGSPGYSNIRPVYTEK